MTGGRKKKEELRKKKTGTAKRPVRKFDARRSD